MKKTVDRPVFDAPRGPGGRGLPDAPAGEGRLGRGAVEGVVGSSPPLGGRSILVIDDRPDAVAALQCALELAGHRVEVAFDREGAIRRAFETKPEVIFCDIELPGHHDGHAVAETLRASPRFRSAYMVALTGCTEPEDVKQAVAAGFDLHVAKPADARVLLRLIEERFEGVGA